MKTSCILILTAVIAIVSKEGTSRYLLVEVDNKETNVDTLIESRQSTCPLVGIRYEETEQNFMSSIYVKDWRKCGNICENFHLPNECKFWTFKRNNRKDSAPGFCILFQTNGELVEDDLSVSGHKRCK